MLRLCDCGDCSGFHCRCTRRREWLSCHARTGLAAAQSQPVGLAAAAQSQHVGLAATAQSQPVGLAAAAQSEPVGLAAAAQSLPVGLAAAAQSEPVGLAAAALSQPVGLAAAQSRTRSAAALSNPAPESTAGSTAGHYRRCQHAKHERLHELIRADARLVRHRHCDRLVPVIAS